MRQNETLWSAIAQDYITSDLSLRELAQKHGVPVGTLARRAKRENWDKQRAEYKQRVLEKTKEKASEEQAEISRLVFQIGRYILERFLDALESGGIKLTPSDAEKWAKILLALDQAGKAGEAQRIIIQWVAEKEEDEQE
jgi:transposase-like protein